MTAVKVVFWVSLAALVWTHVGYVLFVQGLVRLRRGAPVPPAGDRPSVAVIVAAYNEETVIERRVANLLALDYPHDRLEVIVAVDGGGDATARLAREAGADRVLELPRGGKIRAQDAAVKAATGELLAFSDANALWAPDALHGLAAPFADPGVGYVCGRVAGEIDRSAFLPLVAMALGVITGSVLYTAVGVTFGAMHAPLQCSESYCARKITDACQD